jgi:hypothetical protein
MEKHREYYVNYRPVIAFILLMYFHKEHYYEAKGHSLSHTRHGELEEIKRHKYKAAERRVIGKLIDELH